MPFKDLTGFTTPDDSRILWKFLDLAKFMSLIASEELFFARLATFSDPWEGYFPHYYRDHAAVEPAKDAASSNTSQTESEIANELVKEFAMARENFAASCWLENDRDNEAFWKLYSNVEYGLALQTSVKSFKKALEKAVAHDVYITKVNYVDFKKDKPPANNIYWAALHKRIEFQYENEVRAIIWEKQKYDTEPKGIRPFNNPNGVSLKVDIHSLIEEILISPLSPDWFYESIVLLLKKLKMNFKVKKSSLYTPPPPSIPSVWR
jgi:hypothetical protein